MGKITPVSSLRLCQILCHLCFALSVLLFWWIPTATAELRLEKIKIKDQILTVEMAENDQSRTLGLMHRTSLKPRHGMLFVFEDEAPREFWMKNTFIPLSIGYFDKKRVLRAVYEKMEPVKSVMQVNIPRYRSHVPAQFALEVEPGWFKKHKIQIDRDSFEFIPPRALKATKSPSS